MALWTDDWSEEWSKRHMALWIREDITFCSDDGCECMVCERNPKRIRTDGPHSFADYRGTPRCPLSDIEESSDET